MDNYDYDEYERRCEIVRKENDELLKLFKQDLEGLSPKTINKHLSNVDFYINTYLLREDAYRFSEGIYRINEFLGYFFIYKCMWSTPETIKTTAASIKKFYRCMLKHGKIKQDEYDELTLVIKECMPDWQAECAGFNDIDNDDSFFF